MKTQRIRYFHPRGVSLPNGSHVQRGGFLGECRKNKEAFSLDFRHLEGPVGPEACGGVIILPSGTPLAEVPAEPPATSPAIESYSVGQIFHGRYEDTCGNLYDAESPTIKVECLYRELLYELAGKLARILRLEHVLVKDMNDREVYLCEIK